ncbi:hypothetical protein GWK47_001729 [Chionoecetes opilio]|uniref:Uncharacterized protein n=1 Tax=Chionoecetes opilio TaxID=41210 RepID=A0A8J4XTT8_CHIOP|nr:hypothetical protein GWK47_001729 [Chionoecetes opilio]
MQMCKPYRPPNSGGKHVRFRHLGSESDRRTQIGGVESFPYVVLPSCGIDLLSHYTHSSDLTQSLEHSRLQLVRQTGTVAFWMHNGVPNFRLRSCRQARQHHGPTPSPRPYYRDGTRPRPSTPLSWNVSIT